MPDLIKAERWSLPQQNNPPPLVSLDSSVQDQSDIIKHYLHVLNKRKWLIIAAAFTILGGSAVQTYTTAPVYRSTAQIQIDLESANVLPYQDISARPEYFFETESYQKTQFRILQSRPLARRVVKKLNLGEDPAFNAPVRPGALSGLLPRMTDSILGFFGNQDPQASAAPEKQGPDEIGLADRLLGGLVVTPDKDSRLVAVAYNCQDPKLSARIVNTLADEYIEFNFESRFQAATMAHDFLKRELDQLKVTVEKSDEVLIAYAQEHGIVDVSQRENIVLEKLGQLNVEMSKVQADLIAKTVQYEATRNASLQNYPESLKTQSIQALEERLSALNQKVASLMATFKDDWPEVVQTKREVFEVEDQLVKEKQRALGKVRDEFQAASSHYQKISVALEDQKVLANKLSADSIQYNILKREADTNKQLYDGLLQRLKEAGVSAGLRSSNIRVVERAEVPKGPYAPVHRRDLMLGLVVGLMLGLGLAFVIEYFDNTVKTPEDLERYVAIASLGIVPTIEELGSKNRKQLAGDKAVEETAVVPYRVSPRSAVWEAYRSLRTSILLSHSGNPPRRILVTSALPGEGKTTTAINTAIVLSQTGARTLLVDLDMRKPEVGRQFGLNGSHGMSIFLSGNSDLSSQIVETPYADLFVVPAGPLPPNPAELVGSERWQKALGLLSDYFQYIVIDSPPVLSVADPVILSTRVDGVVLVVQAGKTPRDAVRKARNTLQQVGATVLGAMINNVDLENGNYSYYYRYYYRYGYYGDDKEKTA